MAISNDLIAAAKLAKRMTGNSYDSEVERLLSAAMLDLGVAGVELPEPLDDLVDQAAITYFLMNFGEPSDKVYTNLKRSYDEQKAQLATCTGYTTWGLTDE